MRDICALNMYNEHEIYIDYVFRMHYLVFN